MIFCCHGGTHSLQTSSQQAFFWASLIAKFNPFKKIHSLRVVKFSCHSFKYSLVTRCKINSSQNSLVTRWKEYNLQGRSIIFPTKGVGESEN